MMILGPKIRLSGLRGTNQRDSQAPCDRPFHREYTELLNRWHPFCGLIIAWRIPR